MMFKRKKEKKEKKKERNVRNIQDYFEKSRFRFLLLSRIDVQKLHLNDSWREIKVKNGEGEE